MMLFIHTIDKVLSGEKVQTRRIVKPGDEDTIFPMPTDRMFSQRGILYAAYPAHEAREISTVFRNGRRLWNVGQEIAVQPGRGKKSVARILITGLRCEDVREISVEDAKAEGWELGLDAVTKYPALWYLRLWTQMHDDLAHVKLGMKPFETWRDYLATRPAERYQAWVIEFKLVAA